MNKRFSWIFLLVSGAFFLFIVGLTGYRTESARRHNTATARESARSLEARVHSLVDTTGSVLSIPFRNAMREIVDQEPRLVLLALHSPRDGMLYLISRNRAVLKQPASITPQWRGTPVYEVARGSEYLASTALDGNLPGVTMDALFVVMGREDLYPIVRDDLYFFLAFLLVCGVAILIIMSVEEDPDRLMRRSTATNAQAPSSRGPAVSVVHAASDPELRAPAPASEAAAPAGQPLTSPKSGLAWGEHLDPRLKTEIERAASSDQDISFALARIDEPFANARLPMAYAEIAGMLRRSFPQQDLVFETGDDSFGVILPDVDVDSAVRLLDAARSRIASQAIEGRTRTLSVGVSSRGGRLISSSVLREEARVALVKAAREGGNQVVGFRADPARFREKLA